MYAPGLIMNDLPEHVFVIFNNKKLFSFYNKYLFLLRSLSPCKLLDNVNKQQTFILVCNAHFLSSNQFPMDKKSFSHWILYFPQKYTLYWTVTINMNSCYFYNDMHIIEVKCCEKHFMLTNGWVQCVFCVCTATWLTICFSGLQHMKV